MELNLFSFGSDISLNASHLPYNSAIQGTVPVDSDLIVSFIPIQKEIRQFNTIQITIYLKRRDIAVTYDGKENSSFLRKELHQMVVWNIPIH